MLQPGLMMDRPLLISGIIEHAAAQFGDSHIVSRESHGPMFRYSFAQCAARVRRLAGALRHLDWGPAVRSHPWPGTITGIWKPTTRCRQRHGDAHLQPAPASRAIDLHHQPRGGPGVAVRSTFAPLIGAIAPIAQDRGLGLPERRGEHARGPRKRRISLL